MKAKDNSDADKRVAKRMEADEDAGDDHRAAEEKASEGNRPAPRNSGVKDDLEVPGTYSDVCHYPSFVGAVSLLPLAITPSLLPSFHPSLLPSFPVDDNNRIEKVRYFPFPGT